MQKVVFKGHNLESNVNIKTVAIVNPKHQNFGLNTQSSLFRQFMAQSIRVNCLKEAWKEWHKTMLTSDIKPSI